MIKEKTVFYQEVKKRKQVGFLDRVESFLVSNEVTDKLMYVLLSLASAYFVAHVVAYLILIR